MIGAGANDTISGGDGADSLSGAAGADSISGGTGADTITGGTGADSMTGGTGADTFVFSTDGSVAGTSLDVISDFASATDILSFPTLSLAAADATTLVATSNVNTTAGGLVSFATADDTYAKMVIAIQADAELDAAGLVAIFVFGSDTYVYYSGAATGNTDDQIVKLTRVSGTAFDTITDLGSTATIG